MSVIRPFCVMRPFYAVIMMTDKNAKNSDEGSGALVPWAAVGAAAIGVDESQHLVDGGGREPELTARSDADDFHVAAHEASHCLSGLVLFGAGSLGGSTICPSKTYGGLTWGREATPPS